MITRWVRLGVLATALLGLLAGPLVASCRSVPTETEADEELVTDLVGRWIGESVGGTDRDWWLNTKWDVVFGKDGDFSAVAAGGVLDKPQSALRFEGEYAVREGGVEVDELNLFGRYSVTFEGKDELVLRGEEGLAMRLKKRFGT
jgi:hypothetical protein